MERFSELLEVEDIHTYYGESYVLQGVSLSASEGKIVAILGRNGMGKTTLIRSIFGLTPPRKGSIKFLGNSIAGLPPYQIAKLGMALVPQGRRIFKNLSVAENLSLPSSFLALGKQFRAANASWDEESVLAEFPQLKDRLKNGGSELSGGEQQMLAIGRALIANPHLILMDEPSEGLSPLFVKHVGTIMTRLRDLGHAVVVVEQNLPLALSVADVVYIIAAGRFVFHGTPGELRNRTDILNEHLGVSGSKSI